MAGREEKKKLVSEAYCLQYASICKKMGSMEVWTAMQRSLGYEP